MSKDSTLSLRIDSELKNEVETILKQLGIPMTTAITMYFNQIKMNNGLPFTPKIINKPKSIYDYTNEELVNEFEKAIDEFKDGKAYTIEQVEEEFNKKISL